MEETSKQSPFSILFFFLLLTAAPVSAQFPFPETTSTAVPDPSKFFSPNLLSSPLPTNSFFQNFVLNNGDSPEYIHPYLIRTANSSLFVSYPSRISNSSINQLQFFPDLVISSLNKTSNATHFVSSFSDLGVDLDIGVFRYHLVRGSPYLTFSVLKTSFVLISTSNGVRSVDSYEDYTKYIIRLNNGRSWLLYSSSAIYLIKSKSNQVVTSGGFIGVIRVAVLPDSAVESEKILDRYSGCYPVSGFAKLSGGFGFEYKWQKKGSGGLLMLAHTLHREILPRDQTVLQNLRYSSIDGDLLGVVGDSWDLKFNPIPITWHSINGIDSKFFPEIVAALKRDVATLNVTELSSTPASYFYGKLLARAARLALIAEEVNYGASVIPAVVKFLKNGIQPWLIGKFPKNGFLYERKWAGLVTKNGATSTIEDFGFGIYNDHHFHLGYFVYSIAVLAKLDPNWGKQYKPQAYALLYDYMNFRPKKSQFSIPFRNFDFWKLHSWAAGLAEFPDGRNQESTSEAVNAYYAAALMGLAYGDASLTAAGSTLTAAEITASQTWWHVKKEKNGIYDKGFAEENRMVGILWSAARESRLWFAPAEWRECRLGIQVLPVLPVTERMFTDVGFVKEAVEWVQPALEREDAGEGWKGFAYALEGIYDKKSAVEKVKKLKKHDDGNSLSNLLWWIYSRPEGRG
ncbi:putative endo-1,3(4)-beta-glucanase 2 precursor [Cucumis melo var. makuwa]|uniref:glucan endo-1,3-beta-D-glucosidase n=1 Tax=Cucumis melo var. makuwa TaxID=1194695 RepID=A0A5A7TDJ6_CUCMM|nr:putative endo-1,3(4)-beta-glucanase 2 precursor [Cucumis melo var. makuwa]TYK00522.1 putative endo-1,3(4)-beta-glucanase 2 precursor [Cucumis melo var. makuwa]